MKPHTLLFVCALALTGASAAAQQAGTLGQPGCLVVKADPAPREKAQWSGACKDGYAHGDGKLTWFIGLAPSGFFEGRMEKGLPLEGYEKAADGAQYEGQYKNGLRDGMGTFVSTRDDRYTGMWKEGKRHGKGKASYGMGGAFEGNWAADRPDGPGKLTWAGGRTVDNVERPDLYMQALPAATDTATEKRHVFKDGVAEPVFGSRARRRERATGYLPFELSYEQMSPSQQAMVRAHYPLLHSADEPPYPLKGEQNMTRWLSEGHDILEGNGTLSMRVMVGANGVPSAVTVFESPDPETGELMTRVMLAERFKPARCAGQPCAMAYAFQFGLRTEYRLPP